MLVIVSAFSGLQITDCINNERKLKMFIVITGLDGSGTSTIAKKLHEMDEGSYLFHTPDEIYADREKIDLKVRKVSQMAHYLYYLSSVAYMSDYIKKNIDYKNNNVYCVRYLIDTVVSHRAAGLEVDLEYDKYDILKPDMTIFVSLEETTRQERINKRGKSLLDKVLDEDSIRNTFLKEFSNLAQESIVFDNGTENVDERLLHLYRTQICRGK